ncbi:hypothetical protein H4R18_000941 [Coemansia javaensis]|uniref:MFS general substrate transporter n=1 Tax=Coemansia javaensis TaxID=2761396 RepID=A0A9W8HGJ4_9FUNG|nr:hypothetical protein H4R18_000941 [Coemansia javaensis]
MAQKQQHQQQRWQRRRRRRQWQGGDDDDDDDEGGGGASKRYPRGMGGLVVFCSFAALALGPGLLNAYGVYEEEYDRLFDRKDERHEWPRALGSPVVFIGVTQIFVANGLGFIGGHYAQRFGPGPAVFTGGLLMAAGLLAASYARQIWQLCLSQGLLFGLGACLVWIPAASSPSSWFSRSRGLATGITHMGLGIGGLVFAPLTRFLLEKSGSAGSLRWLALIVLVAVSVVSMGVHTKKPADHRPLSDIVVSSVRWSKCLDEQLQLADDGGDGLGQRQGVRRSKDPAEEEEEEEGEGEEEEGCAGLDDMAPPTGDISEAPLASPNAPKHVRFAPEVARRAALDRLEGAPGHRRQTQDTAATAKAAAAATAAKPQRTSAGCRPQASVMRSCRFWLLSAGMGLGQAGWYIVLLFIPSIGVSAGLGVHNSAIVLGSINGASAVGQFAAGYAADMVGPVNALLGFTALATAANGLLFVPRLTLRVLLAYACLCGASIGAADPLAVIAGVTQFGRARAATTTGLIYGSVGVLVAVFAPAARVLQQTAPAGAGFAHVYFLVIALFSASSLALVLLRLHMSRRLLVRA